MKIIIESLECSRLLTKKHGRNIIDGSIENFQHNTVSIGKSLAISLNLLVGDQINLISTSTIGTIFGNLPVQESFTISSIFSSGLNEFDQNVIFMPKMPLHCLELLIKINR